MEGRKEEPGLEYEWLKLFCYMVTSARGCIDEPKLYGPFRLVDCVERLISLLEGKGLADDFLKREREKIAQEKYLLMGDEEGFVKFLDELVMDFTRKLKAEREQVG